MKRVVAALAGGLLLIAGADAASGQARPSASFSQLTSERQLTDVYRAIFDARFAEVPSLLARTCPPAPAEA